MVSKRRPTSWPFEGVSGASARDEAGLVALPVFSK